MKQKYPDELFVYAFELDDGTFIYDATTDLGEIPDTHIDEMIGTYALVKTNTLQIKRKLK